MQALETTAVTAPPTAVSDTGNELFQYDQAVVKQINRIEDIITNFAIRNYVTSGTVLAASFATEIPFWAAFLVVLLLNVNFVLAIAHNNWRFKILCKIHELARNSWFQSASKDEAFGLLQPHLNRMTVEEIGWRASLSQTDFKHLAVFANLLPAFAALVLLILWALGVKLR